MKDFKDMKDIMKAENNKKKNILIYIAALLAVQMITFSMAGCAVSSAGNASSAIGYSDSAAVVTLENDSETSASKNAKTSGGSLSADDLFTDRRSQRRKKSDGHFRPKRHHLQDGRLSHHRQRRKLHHHRRRGR